MKEKTTAELINEIHMEEIMRNQLRQCKSSVDIREIDDQFNEGDEPNEFDAQNFISEPNSPREKEILHNPFFLGRIGELKKIYKMRG